MGGAREAGDGGPGEPGPNLARLLPGVEVRELDHDLGRQAGVLLGPEGQADVVDAAVVLLARDGDEVLTPDVGDRAPLVRAAGRHVALVPV